MSDVIDGAMSMSVGVELFVGIAAVVLGVIGIVSRTPAVVLVGLLGVGAGMCLSGAAHGARVFARAHPR